MNITYYTGAGASYHAMPILDELGNYMILLADNCLNSLRQNDIIPGVTPFHSATSDFGQLFHKMKKFGQLSLEYGTIDTYARRLHWLGNKEPELSDLKATLSLFFTLWQIVDRQNLPIKSDVQIKSDPIDKRYLSLLSTVMKKSEEQIRLNPNVRFITWNYDLQIECTYQMFNEFDSKWDEIRNGISYKWDSKVPEVCHLNGYSSHYTCRENKQQIERSIFDDIDISKMGKILLRDALKALVNQGDEIKNGEINYKDAINYAWEGGDRNTRVRENAINIMSNTEVLVVIGYSFPSFNQEVDKSLFEALPNNAKVIYQDRNSTSRIKQLLNGANKRFLIGEKVVKADGPHIIELKHETDLSQFYLPYGI